MQQPYILVIDDDEGITEVVQIILETEGYTVRTGHDAGFLRHLSPPPQLILLDHLLAGEEDGSTLCRHLKHDPLTASIPVILLSAHTDTGVLADKSGADGFLEKPFDVDVLLEVVQRFLSGPTTNLVG